jgi:hypothetical protein
MKRIAVAIPMLLAAADAWAINRYDVESMTCEKVQAILAEEGAAILRYHSSSILSLPLYDRYVKNQQYCGAGEVASRTGVPTADRKYCPVYKCVESQLFIAR